jgi:hypothetical protein
MTAIGDWRHLTHKPCPALTWRGFAQKMIVIAVLIAN